MFDKFKKPWRIIKGDTVFVRTGAERTKTGVVAQVNRDSNTVVVEGLNLKKKHVKKTEEQPGGVYLVEGKIHYSNVALMDPETGLPCRTTYRYLEDGTKVRVAQGKKTSGSIIPFPEFQRKKPRSVVVGPKCTPEGEVNRVTYTSSRGYSVLNAVGCDGLTGASPARVQVGFAASRFFGGLSQPLLR